MNESAKEVQGINDILNGVILCGKKFNLFQRNDTDRFTQDQLEKFDSCFDMYYGLVFEMANKFID